MRWKLIYEQLRTAQGWNTASSPEENGMTASESAADQDEFVRACGELGIVYVPFHAVAAQQSPTWEVRLAYGLPGVVLGRASSDARVLACHPGRCGRA
ncbi:hypothetical protein J7F01_15365 [Streptomyces sp. ISL-22]|uniref:hypothetical protein n=1 Tax=unclassified Streptomyces TaxID=2593676 RepID=UPI001BE7770A|nr:MULTISPECIES: hypothetical protein [unclassified Streptomyces]MBT2423816.1 hypothetical protein [Streptomyces sp. ISL-24]MBT2433536.1 hypothetical protein [Streptomyces sp. ISL-22]